MNDIHQQARDNETKYLSVLKQLYEKTEARADRTNTGTQSIFGVSIDFDISNNVLPLLSSKSVFTKGIVHELIWMLSGEKSIKYLLDNEVHIWDDWLVPGTEVRDEDGTLIDGISSSIYSESWRGWEDTRILSFSQLGDIPSIDLEDREMTKYEIAGQFDNKVVVTRRIDQIEQILWQLRNKPTSRRIILNAWNAARVSDVLLPPCHVMAQFYVETIDGENYLSCQMYQRSCDYFLGGAFNIVQYSILTHLLAAATGMKSKDFKWCIGDCHLYLNHLEQANEQLNRSLIEDNAPILNLSVNNGSDLNDLHFDQFNISGYRSQSAIKAPIAV